MSINRPTLLIIAGAALVGGAVFVPAAWDHWHERKPAAPQPLRAALWPVDDLAAGAGLEHPFGLVLAPDGRRVVFPATRTGASQLWIRDLVTGETAPLPGTDGGVLPFWSDDGRQLGFFADRRLKTLALETGERSDVAEAATPRGGAWHPGGDIIFAPATDGPLHRRRADSGRIEPFTTLDATAGESSHRFPVVFNDGRHVLFFVRATDSSRGGLWIAPVAAPHRRVRLIGSDRSALAAGNWLFFASEYALVAQQIVGLDHEDAKVALEGRAFLVGTHVGKSALDQLSATVAADVVVYGAPVPDQRELRWVSRHGATEQTIASHVEAWDVRVAPRGSAVAVTQRDPQLGTLDVWMYERDRPLPRRISTGIDIDESPVWSADGTRIAWVAARRALNVRGAQGQLPDQTLRKLDAPIRLWDWTADGRSFVVGQTASTTKDDLWIADVDGAAKAAPTPYAQSPFNETQAALAPDGKWIAYASDESGRMEVYVDSFPTSGHRARVTNGGGSEPRWVPQRDELIFKRGAEVYATKMILTGATPEASSATRLFDAGGDIRSYDVSADGRHFVVNVPSPAVNPRPITVVVHWQSLLGSPGTGDRQ